MNVSSLTEVTGNNNNNPGGKDNSIATTSVSNLGNSKKAEEMRSVAKTALKNSLLEISNTFTSDHMSLIVTQQEKVLTSNMQVLYGKS